MLLSFPFDPGEEYSHHMNDSTNIHMLNHYYVQLLKNIGQHYNLIPAHIYTSSPNSMISIMNGRYPIHTLCSMYIRLEMLSSHTTCTFFIPFEIHMLQLIPLGLEIFAISHHMYFLLTKKNFFQEIVHWALRGRAWERR